MYALSRDASTALSLDWSLACPGSEEIDSESRALPYGNNHAPYACNEGDRRFPLAAIQGLTDAVGLETVGWPTREGFIRWFLDPECSTLSSQTLGACDDTGIISLVAPIPGEGPGSAGFWLFDPMDPGELWAPARP
jgi:hypothetical protein